jgi:hypothetical protein
MNSVIDVRQRAPARQDRPVTQPPRRTASSTERVVFIAAAVILVLGMQMPVAHYLSPKTGIGYALGITGGVMLLMQGLYAIRKRVPALRFLGTVPHWFQMHMMLGVVAPVLILIHCGFTLGATNSNIALISMLLVAGSGIFGRYFYSKIHHGLYGRKATLAELQRNAQELKDRGTRILMLPELIDRLEDEERRVLRVADWGAIGMALAPFAIAVRHAFGSRRLRRYANTAINVMAARHKAVAIQKDRFETLAFDYIKRRMGVTREVAEFRVYERLFSVWHVLHVPLFLMLLAAGIVHVVSVHVY